MIMPAKFSYVLAVPLFEIGIDAAALDMPAFENGSRPISNQPVAVTTGGLVLVWRLLCVPYATTRLVGNPFGVIPPAIENWKLNCVVQGAVHVLLPP
jgi:hypothetical protein